MIKFLLFTLISFNAHAQLEKLVPGWTELKSEYLNTISPSQANQKNATKKYSFISKPGEKGEAKYMLYCYSANGMEIPRYSGVSLAAWQGKILSTDVETVDGRFIRVPSGNCFIESVVNKSK